MTSLILCLLGDALCNRYFIKIFTYINIPGIICPPRILEVKHTQHFFTIGFCNALVAFITEFPLRFPSWRSQTTMLLKGTTKRYNLKRDFNLWLLENGNFDIMQRALAGSPRRGSDKRKLQGCGLASNCIFNICLPPVVNCEVNSLASGTKEGLVGGGGTTYKETYFNNIPKSQPWHPVKHHYEEDTHCMRWSKNPHRDPSSSGTCHILPRISATGMFFPQHLESCCSIFLGFLRSLFFFSLSCIYARDTHSWETPFRLSSYKHSSSFDYPLHFLNSQFSCSYPSPVLTLPSHTACVHCNQHTQKPSSP